MFRKFILPALAVLGVFFGIYMVRAGNKAPKPAEPVAQPARSPFPIKVTGSGLVESQTRDIAIGTPVAGLVTAVYVQVNDPIRAGLPHELVRRLVPLLTTGSPEERFDESIVAIGGPASQPATRATPVNINTATEAELAAIPGVGDARAARIVAGRPYASPWDLEGSPLFKIDDRQARADLAIKRGPRRRPGTGWTSRWPAREARTCWSPGRRWTRRRPPTTWPSGTTSGGPR